MLIGNFLGFLILRRPRYWHFSKFGWVVLGREVPSIICLEREVLRFVRGDDKVLSTCFSHYNNVLLSMNAVPSSIEIQPLLRLTVL